MIFIIGAGGMLGQSMVRLLSASGLQFVCAQKNDFDIRDEVGTRRLFKKFTPKFVINCAAKTNVDWCEKNEEEAMDVNGYAVGKLARSVQSIGAKFFNISTDYVFDGTKNGAYTEDDIPNPLQVYGKSKLLGENLVLEEKGFNIRVQWLYGLNKQTFVSRVIDAVKTGQKINISTKQIGSPTSALWASSVLLGALPNFQMAGTYHLAHNSHVSRIEFAKYLIEGIGKNPEDYIIPDNSESFGIARRPQKVVLCNIKFKQHMKIDFLSSWQEDINAFMKREYLLGLKYEHRNVENGMHKDPSEIFCG